MRDYRPQAQKSLLDKGLQAFAQTRFGGWLFISVFPTIDRALIPVTRGKLSTGLGQPIVLLHTRGARSGVERTAPLLATKQGELVVVIASKAGAVKHPGWYHNVKAGPEVEVTLGGRRVPMRAEIAEGAERDRLWAMACDNYVGYETYQRRAGERVIPVVALRPR
ncbi:nitroreductase/quinone reductase family protein [Baekduia sp.]|jgi:deazaflavin-dependent oxidoreductase (nitroreductase family)|uniref:nitroreductase/quinone reductase family protein n=1 Tax=Baekduia sp. TaxID=2600305 RepID=UPI002E049A4C|nr:nitroreductase/quinone reductase family protein [Baekduia sp.]